MENGELFKALCEAQKAFKTPVKNRKAAYGMYADLQAIMQAVRPALNANGLFVGQKVKHADGGLVVETIIAHQSGESYSFGELFMPVGASKGMNQAQAFGSAETYARRYALSAALGVVADDDDDGQSAGSRSQTDAPVVQEVPLELEARARECAEMGLSEYEKFFSGISKQERQMLVRSGAHADLKALAVAAGE